MRRCCTGRCIGTLWAAVLTMAGSPPGAASPQADGAAPRGQRVFQTQCAVCHSPLRGHNKIGPSLFGVVGRPAGSAEDFAYSEAMKSSGVRWSEANIKTYLQGPQKFIPGVRMTFNTPLASDTVDDLVAFLASLH